MGHLNTIETLHFKDKCTEIIVLHNDFYLRMNSRRLMRGK